MISAGVLRGANSAYHDDTSNPDSVSASGGSIGAAASRARELTASPRAWRDSMRDIMEPTLPKITSVRPASRSVMADCTMGRQASMDLGVKYPWITLRISSSVGCHSALPDSSLAISSTWLIRRVSRSVSFVMMPRKRLRSERSIAGSSNRISEKARIEVSGVRSSWLTVEIKSSFIRSSSLSRSLAARSSPVASSNSRDFCSSCRE